MIAISQTRSKNQKGNEIVEFGLVFGILFFMIVGALDFSQFLFVHQTIV